MRGGFDLHILFGFDGLVQSVGVSSSLQDTACLFVDNLHLIIHHHVFNVLLKESISFQQLVYGVYTFCLDGIVAHQGAFFLQQIRLIQLLFLQFRQLRTNIRKDVKGCIFIRLCQQVYPLFGEFNGVVLLIDDKKEFIIDDVHVFRLFLQVEVLGFLHQGLHPRLTEEFDERFVFG